MIRVVVLELIVLGLAWLFAQNLWRARTTGKIMHSGTNLASRKRQPKTFWSLVLFNFLMLALMAFSAFDVALS